MSDSHGCPGLSFKRHDRRFGSVVAASKLLGLTTEQTRNAIAIAATMFAGPGVNHGTMSKPLNMGRSSETGVTAARLASLGFDGPANALEGGRGFFEAFGGGFDPSRILGRLGSPWAIIEPGTSVKPYPSVSSAIRAWMP